MNATLAGKATVLYLAAEPGAPNVAAYGRVFDLTPRQKAELYDAAGLKPIELSLENFAKAFEAQAQEDAASFQEPVAS
jgi:hypothetical protein